MICKQKSKEEKMADFILIKERRSALTPAKPGKQWEDRVAGADAIEREEKIPEAKNYVPEKRRRTDSNKLN